MSITHREWISARDKVLPLLRDCPWPMAKIQLIEAAREYFTETGAWGIWTDDLFTVATIGEYIPYSGKQSEVYDVRECKVGTIDHSGANERDYGSAQNDQKAAPIASWFNNQLNIWPLPTQNNLAIRAFLLVRPADAATGLPREQWVPHIDHVVLGALRNLYGAHDKPYSNPQKYAEHKEMFTNAMNKARSAAAKGGYARKRTIYQDF